MTTSAQTQIEVITRCDDLSRWVGEKKKSAARIGLVPTMGALHDGHISLIRAIRQKCNSVVVSIFVNPTQFGPREDFSAYPRTLAEDLQRLRSEQVDLVFAPTAEEIYPPGYSTYVLPPAAAQPLEGARRPGHFQGVATVVLKLFNLVQPAIACFGQKDFQQSVVIRQLVRDLNLPVEIELAPTVREPDGLALSSRNRYLSSMERKIASSIFQALQMTVRKIEQGERSGAGLTAEMTRYLLEAKVTAVEYAVVCDPETLLAQEQIEKPAVILIAARVGTTRLIDNHLLS